MSIEEEIKEIESELQNARDLRDYGYNPGNSHGQTLSSWRKEWSIQIHDYENQLRRLRHKLSKEQ